MSIVYFAFAGVPLFGAETGGCTPCWRSPRLFSGLADNFVNNSSAQLRNVLTDQHVMRK